MNSQAFPEWNFEDTRQYGLIAQEVEKIFPEMVKTIDAKGYKGVDYMKLIPVLVEAIKEQQKQIEDLKKAVQNK
jgi:Ca2+-binding EF-hand superfamily protein